jgi:ABC-type sugar transport system permease subunit
LINAMLQPLAKLLHTTPPDWFGKDAARWAVPGFVIMSLWGVGGAMILYLAGLKGIPVSLYEAATIDGAGHVRQLWNVTLPMLSPLIFYNVIMALIASFQFFVQAKVMTNGGPDNLTLFYVLNLYRQAFEFHNMGYASALAWVLFLILLGLTILVFRASKNVVYYEGLKA